ncbi:MAG: (2Fe-2S)-binding protein, partial [Candidatus Aegiribacteria sp.]|nr:(2Fe-2S)-binding protein [Candidatus Aegiribacteria sp.]
MTDTTMITVEIDGKSISVEKNTTILEAAQKLDIYIPALCNSELVEPYAACRLCVVDVHDGRKTKLVTSCNYPIRKSLKIDTLSERVLRNRKGILEMMLSRWPNVQLIKDLAKHAGIEEPRYQHPAVDLNPNACILCGLCMRICEQGIWENIINFTNRGAVRAVRMPYDSDQPHCIGCGACAEICPTGAITMVDDPNRPYDADMVRRAGMRITEEMIRFDEEQCDMRGVGTAHLVEIMDAYDLLPVMNYQYGKHEETPKISSDVLRTFFTKGKPDGCWLGCTMACAKAI